jgi:hypothetical protein
MLAAKLAGNRKSEELFVAELSDQLTRCRFNIAGWFTDFD